MVAGHIRKRQVRFVRVPDRALDEVETGRYAFEFDSLADHLPERRVADFHVHEPAHCLLRRFSTLVGPTNQSRASTSSNTTQTSSSAKPVASFTAATTCSAIAAFALGVAGNCFPNETNIDER